MSIKNIAKKRKQEQLLIAAQVKQIREEAGNSVCADCPVRSTSYVCINYSTFICTECSGIHRNKFNHRVKSVAVATFTENEIKNIRQFGNKYVNRRYLARYKVGRDSFKLPREGDKKQIEKFIQLKYIDKKWYKENPPKKDKKKKTKKKKKKRERSDTESSDTDISSEPNKTIKELFSFKDMQFGKSLLFPYGTLFENEFIQIGFRSQIEIPGGVMKVLLFYGNKLMSGISVQSVRFINNDSCKSVQIQFTPRSFNIGAKQQIKQQCRISLMAPILQLPNIEIKFIANNTSYSLKYRLPVIASTFFKPYNIYSNINFEKRWAMLKTEKRQVVKKPSNYDRNKCRDMLINCMNLGVVESAFSKNHLYGCAVYHFAKKKSDNNFLSIPVLITLYDDNEYSPHNIDITVRSPLQSVSDSVMNAFVTIFDSKYTHQYIASIPVENKQQNHNAMGWNDDSLWSTQPQPVQQKDSNVGGDVKTDSNDLWAAIALMDQEKILQNTDNISSSKHEIFRLKEEIKDIKTKLENKTAECLSYQSALENAKQEIQLQQATVLSLEQMVRETHQTIETNKELKQQVEKLENDQKEFEIENFGLKQKIKMLTINTDNYQNWTSDDIVIWIVSLNKDFKRYENMLRRELKEEQLIGIHLENIDLSEIKGWGIKIVDHKREIFKNIKKLTSNNNNNNYIANNNEGQNTAYI